MFFVSSGSESRGNRTSKRSPFAALLSTGWASRGRLGHSSQERSFPLRVLIVDKVVLAELLVVIPHALEGSPREHRADVVVEILLEGHIEEVVTQPTLEFLQDPRMVRNDLGAI